MLTTAQLQALKNDITVTRASTVYQGNTLLSYWQTTQTQKIADFYNQTASPQVDLWRSDIPVGDACNQVVMSDFIALTVAKQNGWFVMTQSATIDATNTLVRTNFQTLFGAGTASLTNLTAAAKKPATYFEALFTTSGVTAVYKQLLTAQDVYSAINS